MIFTIKNDEKEILYHNFIIISLKNELTRVLYFEENFQLNEENNEFNFLSEATLFCKRIKIYNETILKSFAFILQATKNTLRLLDLNGFFFKKHNFFNFVNEKESHIMTYTKEKKKISSKLHILTITFFF